MKVYRKSDDDSIAAGERPVSINGVQPELVLGVMLASTVYEDLGYRFVLTDLVSPRDGRSFHPVGLAFDCRTWDVPSDKVGELVLALREALGKEWDVVVYDTHIHIEMDVD